MRAWRNLAPPAGLCFGGARLSHWSAGRFAATWQRAIYCRRSCRARLATIKEYHRFITVVARFFVKLKQLLRPQVGQIQASRAEPSRPTCLGGKTSAGCLEVARLG